MILDRSKAPVFKVPEDFELFPPAEFKLPNNSKLFHISTPGIDAVKIEAISKSNRASLPLDQMLLPTFTLHMIQEGIAGKNAEELADFFDFHASEVSPILNFEHEGFSLLTTKKHIYEVLPVFAQLFTESIFPEDMLLKKQSQRKLGLRLEKEKTSSRASQLFRKNLFGGSHPYGAEPEEKHVDAINTDLIRDYYQNKSWQGLEIFVTGDLDSSELNQIIKELGGLPNRKVENQGILPPGETLQATVESREKSVQSSIRIGGLSIPKSHPEFMGLSVFNTILGGYFGSRLVKNIREDKGHTYGIYSSLAEIGDANYWVIAADVQKAFYPEVIREIYLEINRMVISPIDEDELETVRNFMIGQMLSRFSSSFDLMDRFISVHHSGMELDYYTDKLDYLKNFTAENMMEIGKKYFSAPPFVEVVVG